MNSIGLVTITHDPNGRYIDLFIKHLTYITKLYGEIYLTISNQSSKAWKRALKVDPQINFKTIPKQGAAHARREAVTFGLSGKCEYFHYIDLDRLLTWCERYPEELRGIVSKIPGRPYTILGRTERAFLTHPEDWVETERITNKICSLELKKEVDITAGSSAFSRECAKRIAIKSKSDMTDAEWPMIVYRIMKQPIHYLEVEGLEYWEEANSMTRKVSEGEKWVGRLKLALIISESAITTGKGEA
ncbi:hypothetical protein [Sutcliffiella horikoshii]|uniref:hypothetical protein n=1 Tax=Sutcliffiella horikoshii TaxID=79883 RepID=UPI001F30598D|nr:hypothetical protein [Sutcliffiella horikoshii]MCG1020353.1 hypothetical protein [Sutcliffiella horikoshii]